MPALGADVLPSRNWWRRAARLEPTNALRYE